MKRIRVEYDNVAAEYLKEKDVEINSKIKEKYELAQQVNANEGEIKSLQQKLKAEKDKSNKFLEKLKIKDNEIDKI